MSHLFYSNSFLQLFTSFLETNTSLKNIIYAAKSRLHLFFSLRLFNSKLKNVVCEPVAVWCETYREHSRERGREEEEQQGQQLTISD